MMNGSELRMSLMHFLWLLLTIIKYHDRCSSSKFPTKIDWLIDAASEIIVANSRRKTFEKTMEWSNKSGKIKLHWKRKNLCINFCVYLSFTAFGVKAPYGFHSESLIQLTKISQWALLWRKMWTSIPFLAIPLLGFQNWNPAQIFTCNC